jgi:hypothetical protein
MRYYEYYTPNGDYDLIEIGTQDWDTAIEYKITGWSNNEWCVHIAGEYIGCYFIRPVPSTIQVFSEIHDNPSIEILTYFEQAQYRKSDGEYELFNQNHYDANFPYEIEIVHEYDSFITKRMDTFDVFCPLILKN